MTEIINRTITEFDGVRPTAFTFGVQKLPNVSFFCQSASLPPMQLGTANFDTPLINIPVAGDKLVFDSLTIKFQIQENFQNYLELYNWMVILGFPQDRAQYGERNVRARTRADVERPPVRKSDIEDYSDATLTVYSSDNNPVISWRFIDCFPVRLEAIEFDTTDKTGDIMIGQATFAYRQYEPAVV